MQIAPKCTTKQDCSRQKSGGGELLDYNYRSASRKATSYRFRGSFNRIFSGLNNSDPQPPGIQAVKQVIDKGHTMTDVAQRLGVTYKSLHTWVQKYGRSDDPRESGDAQPSVQYTSSHWRTFLEDHNLEASMSRRGNCHDNTDAESFFSLLKKDRVKRKSYKTRECKV